MYRPPYINSKLELKQFKYNISEQLVNKIQYL